MDTTPRKAMHARCERCGSPSAGATVLSTHDTSQGAVRYRRCVCGTVSIELATPSGSERTRIEAIVNRPERRNGV